MVENHPAKIAKYLLKGWCLLNEYCPNGQNIPLVRSKEGTLVCAGCESSCPHFSTHGDQASLGGTAGASLAPVQTAVAAPAATMTGAAPVASPASAMTSMATSPGLVPSLPASPLRSGGAAALVSPADFTLQGPEHKFSCIRLGNRTRGAPKLLGEAYVAKIRAGVASLGSSPDVSAVLQEAFGNACGQLSDRILMPATCPGAEISRSYGQVTIALTQSEGSFVVPECECIFFPAVAPELVAKWLLEALQREELTSGLKNRGVRWLEVFLSTSTGDVTYRQTLSGCEFAAVANDW